MIHPDESSLVPAVTVDNDVNVPTLTSIKITDENILNSLKKLKLGKSNGVDGIGNNIFRACAPSITEPLKMIAQSIDTGVFPKSWKQSNVVPISKHKGLRIWWLITDRFHFCFACLKLWKNRSTMSYTIFAWKMDYYLKKIRG